MRLTGLKAAVLVSEGVEELEFYVPLMRLREEGVDVVAAAMAVKPVKGKNGLEVVPTGLIGDLRSGVLDAVIVPGGWAPALLVTGCSGPRRSAALPETGKERFMNFKTSPQRRKGAEERKGKPSVCLFARPHASDPSRQKMLHLFSELSSRPFASLRLCVEALPLPSCSEGARP
jgi:hypothetical protein